MSISILIMTEIQLIMPIIHLSSPRSHQERIGATIKQLEGEILNDDRILCWAPAAPHATGARPSGTPPTTLGKYLEENSDEEGAVVFTRACEMAMANGREAHATDRGLLLMITQSGAGVWNEQDKKKARADHDCGRLGVSVISRMH